MSNRALSFFNEWATEHVNAKPYSEHEVEAKLLAKECIADAEKDGITERELEEALTQDVISELRGRLGARADEEVTRMVKKGG
jgi:hypothetical protein